MFTACIILRIWNVPDGAKYFAFYVGGFHSMASPILVRVWLWDRILQPHKLTIIQYSWVNFTLKENYGERGLIISSMMTIGFGTKIWLPLLTFPKVKAPRFSKGYPASIAFEFVMWAILVGGSLYMERWRKLNPDLDTQLAEESHSSTDFGLGRSSDEDKHIQEQIVEPESSRKNVKMVSSV